MLRDGLPARWCRVLATGPTAAEAGRAHTDERGEFVLLVHDTGQNPITGTVTLDLSVTALKVPAPVDPHDRCADLVRRRSPAPPTRPSPATWTIRCSAASRHRPGSPPTSTLPDSADTGRGREHLSGDPLVFIPQP